MGCFCHHTVPPVTNALAQLGASAFVTAPKISPKQLAAEALAAALSQWLAAHGLPAAPWQPDPAWLETPPPQTRLSAQAMATISAFAQLRAQALAQFGLDLLIPAQAKAMARIVATMSARLAAMTSAMPAPPTALIQLAALLDAVARVELAAQAGLLAPPPPLMQALAMPAGIPMSAFAALLRAVKALAPLLAAATQMNLTSTEQLSASLRAMRSVSLPSLPPAQLAAMASATATLSAVARLQAGLKLDPLKVGIGPIRTAVVARLAAVVQMLPPGMAAPLPEAMAMLPKLPYVPTNLAPAAVVQTALSAQAMAEINWQVPPITAVPALQVGLPTCALTAQIQASLGVTAVQPAPCGSGCDAAKIMRAMAA